MHTLTPNTFADLARLVHDLCGISLGPDKAYLVRHRLEPLLHERGMKSFDDLVKQARAVGMSELRDAMIDAITTRETSFFRDDHPFEAIRQHWLPLVVQKMNQPGSVKRVRIWSAACSHGQEPYSLAITLRDFFDTTAGHLADRFSILATDVSNQALRVARLGQFSEMELSRGLSKAMIARHFESQGQFHVVRPAVRRFVEFVRHNLLASQTPGLNLGFFDLIFCRNVLIYFSLPVQEQVVRMLSESLLPGGLLIVGAAESLHNLRHPLVSVRLGKTVAYQRD